MSFKYPASGGGDFTPVPEGVHIGTCYMVIDIGEQETNFGPKNQVFIRWEIPAERTEDDKPMIIGERFTASMNAKANLRKRLEAWRGKKFTDSEAENFDVSSVLGKACQIQVVHNTRDEKTYANIGTLMALPAGVSAPDVENQLISYSRDEGDTTVAMALPNFIRKWCGLPEIGEGAPAGANTSGGLDPAIHKDGPDGPDDQIPF